MRQDKEDPAVTIVRRVEISAEQRVSGPSNRRRATKCAGTAGADFTHRADKQQDRNQVPAAFSIRTRESPKLVSARSGVAAEDINRT